MWELLSWGQSWDENFSFLLYYQVEIWANKPLEPLDAESSFHLIPSPYSSLTENEGQVSSDVTSKIGNGKKQLKRTACHPATCHLATLPSCSTKRLDVSSCDFNSKVSDISASCHGTPQRLQVNHVWWPLMTKLPTHSLWSKVLGFPNTNCQPNEKSRHSRQLKHGHQTSKCMRMTVNHKDNLSN